VVIDNTYALVGGINISDNYNDTVESPAWLDWALFVEGNIAKGLTSVCERRIKAVKRGQSSVGAPITDVEDQSKYQIRIRINDWVRRKKEITTSYLDMLKSATSHVTIMSSYFLPGQELRKQLALASKRGVRIRVVMGNHSDVATARYAEQYMYRWLLRNNIEIYEYLPKIVHSKIATYDSKWLTVGSYNVNNISAYASIELNLDVNDASFVQQVETRLNRIIALDCILITEEEYKMRATLWQQFLQRSAYDIFRFMFFIFTFYFKQRERE
jgi:cardiolipin synthase